MLSSAPRVLLLLAFLGAVSFAVPVVTIVQRRIRDTDGSGLLAGSIWTVLIVGTLATATSKSFHAISSLLFTTGTAFGALFMIAVGLAVWRAPNAPNKGLIGFGVGYAAITILSLILNGGPFSQKDQVQLFGLAWLPGFLLLIRACTMTREAMVQLCYRVTAVIVYLSVVLSFIAPSWTYHNDLESQRRYVVFGLTKRLAGVLPHSNLLAITAVLLTIIAAHLRPRFWQLTIAISVLAIFLAEARNATLTILVAALVGFVFAGRSKFVRVVAAAPVVAAAVFVIFRYIGSSSDETSAVGSAGLATNLSNFNGRSKVWSLTLDEWPHHFTYGYGPLAFQSNSSSPFALPKTGFLNAHDAFFESIVEGGLFGLILWVGFTVMVIRIGWRHRNTGFYPAVVAAAIVGMTTEVFFTLQLYGLSSSIVPAILFFVLLMSADARSENAVSSSEVARTAERQSAARGERASGQGAIR